jgi:hypothetical protein
MPSYKISFLFLKVMFFPKKEFIMHLLLNNAKKKKFEWIFNQKFLNYEWS